MEIEGFENYLIFENGDVINKNTGKKLKPSLNSRGYNQIVLCKNGKTKTKSIHRVLAQAYLPNPKNKLQVDHINRIKTDNRLENLRWATHSENNVNRILKINKSTHKHITKRKYGYCIIIKRNRLTYNKNKLTLEEAIIQRDLMLSMFTN
jgi:hypothetical protein